MNVERPLILKLGTLDVGWVGTMPVVFKDKLFFPATDIWDGERVLLEIGHPLPARQRVDAPASTRHSANSRMP